MIGARVWVVVATIAFGGVLGGCGSTRTVVRTERTVTVEQKVSTAASTTATTPSLAGLMSRVQSGIVRIEADTCGGTNIGTGFEISRRVVATVERVVDGASAIRIKQNGQLIAHGNIIGADPSQDLALLLTDEPLHGDILRLADRQPQLGEEVAAIGFPLGLPLSVTQGAVSGLNRSIPINGYDRQNLIQTDAAVNPGNSGGPLISINTGDVVGLVDLRTDMANGLGFAVSSSVALREFAGWNNKRQPVHALSCANTPAALAASAQLPPYYVLPPYGNTPSGNTPSGNTPSGNTPSGNTPSGNTPSGNTPSGNTPSGNTPSGNTPSGNTPSGNTPSGNTPSGKTPSGNTPSGNTPSGNTPSGNTPSGNTGTSSTSGSTGSTGTG